MNRFSLTASTLLVLFFSMSAAQAAKVGFVNTERFTAPGRFYGHLGKRARRDKDVNCEAALWGTVSSFCTNPKCMHHLKPVMQVRLEHVEEKL